jgi:hypothetical protein
MISYRKLFKLNFLRGLSLRQSIVMATLCYVILFLISYFIIGIVGMLIVGIIFISYDIYKTRKNIKLIYNS